jgi:hypothetical protein
MIIEYKGYQIKPNPQSPKTYLVATSGRGGKIPDVLSGMFTSVGVVKGIIDGYVESKEELNGKKGNKGGI